MKERICALFVFDGFADWEPALATAGLNNFSNMAIHTFSVDGQPVVSTGGLRLLPDSSLQEMETEAIDLLLLPGGEAWEKGENAEIIPLVRQMATRQKTIAAICAATVFIGNLGLLDHISHTSNSLEYLQQSAPHYRGTSLYQNVPAIQSGHIITANGAAMIEFAYEILKTFSSLDQQVMDAWKTLQKSGGMQQGPFV